MMNEEKKPKITNEEKGLLATSVVKFFTLLLFSAGVILGMGTYLFLGNRDLAEALVVILLAVATIFGVFVFGKGVQHREGNVARFLVLLILVAGILSGIASTLLVGNPGSIAVLIFLLMIILVYGIWIFRSKDA